MTGSGCNLQPMFARTCNLPMMTLSSESTRSASGTGSRRPKAGVDDDSAADEEGPDEESVEKGQQLVVLEAMKMEHTMKAPADATVATISAQEGEVVSQKAVLISFAAEEAAAAA